MAAYDIPQLQNKIAEQKHDIVVLQNENTQLKRKNEALEYKLDDLIHKIAKLEGGYNGLCDQIAKLDVKMGLHLEDHDQKQQAYNFMKSLTELGDAPEEDEAWAHLQSGD